MTLAWVMTSRSGSSFRITCAAHWCHTLQEEFGPALVPGFATAMGSAGQYVFESTTSLKWAFEAIHSNAGIHICACESP